MILVGLVAPVFAAGLVVARLAQCFEMLCAMIFDALLFAPLPFGR